MPVAMSSSTFSTAGASVVSSVIDDEYSLSTTSRLGLTDSGSATKVASPDEAAVKLNRS